MQPPAGSQVSRVPAQRTPQEDLAPAPALPVPVPPRRRMRTVLTVAGVMLTVLCLSGAVTAYILYDRASAPDRSAPDVAVVNYLRAFLIDRNDARADLFTCGKGSEGLAELRALRTDLESREKRFGTSFSTKWGGLAVQENGEQATVNVDLTISAFVDGISQSDRQSWQFSTRVEGDWRVCSAAKVG
ncbi:hypothetical protein GA0074692_5558 [Micromonospora pallida]|uniref:Uncharacterized protein n=1 Tax=Micromonospora pallida TaxID=145854 RepID=A0A1C6TDV5_9ACTN|nr:hypothetical protein [Micromonospora pallida]SCL39996.1 hypothetical protein GA0074692_5558 [Micromonospora pallida]